ncbi:MAG: hypothetical protein ACXV5F_05795 [Halobacteriota archaeon]
MVRIPDMCPLSELQMHDSIRVLRCGGFRDHLGQTFCSTDVKWIQCIAIDKATEVLNEPLSDQGARRLVKFAAPLFPASRFEEWPDWFTSNFLWIACGASGINVLSIAF